MGDTMDLLLKVSLVIFMAGSLLEMGLKLDPHEALNGLRDTRFTILTLAWCFVLCPALAWGITRLIPLDPALAAGLILLGLTPCAPFLPVLAEKAEGDLGYTAAFMLVASVGTVIIMPFAVPRMVEGLSVGAWTIARPLVIVVLLPLVIGMVILRASPTAAAKIQPSIKKLTGLSGIAVVVLAVIIYGKGLLGLPGSFALLAQLLFFVPVAFVSYRLGFGMPHGQKIVLTEGVTTRNVGAALAPLFSTAAIDQRAVIMIVLGLPVMTVVAVVAARRLGPAPAESGSSAG